MLNNRKFKFNIVKSLTFDHIDLYLSTSNMDAKNVAILYGILGLIENKIKIQNIEEDGVFNIKFRGKFMPLKGVIYGV